MNPAAVEVVVTEGRVTVERTTSPAVAAAAPAPYDHVVDPSAVAIVAAGNRAVVDLEATAATLRPQVEPMPAKEIVLHDAR